VRNADAPIGAEQSSSPRSVPIDLMGRLVRSRRAHPRPERTDVAPQEDNVTSELCIPMPTIGVPALTQRERVVLGELGDDVTLEEVAARLWVTRNTVKTQLRSVYRKIGVSTRAEAVAWARANGI
jgi:DNA-binding CsgD family transcriptional regulator